MPTQTYANLHAAVDAVLVAAGAEAPAGSNTKNGMTQKLSTLVGYFEDTTNSQGTVTQKGLTSLVADVKDKVNTTNTNLGSSTST